jgi:cellulose synthase/poly-beta-1,6-N-acetylglucosamine synthase-like glycosyltransferase
VAPFLLYSALYLTVGVDVSRVGFWVVLAAVVITALTVYAEAVLALRRCSPPSEELGCYPAASAIVVAYLPNETSTILDTVTCILQQDYPGPIEVVLAYNTPRRLPIEKELAQLAARDPRLILVRVGDSTSKAQNINAALQVVQGEIIGIFDADHRPMATAFRRAAAWLADGADVVQGRSVVRNGDANWLARMVAVEFEGIYAVAHPGRAALHTFGIFGGSNGFWRADLLDRLRMRPDMLTEDIDISIRAVFDGCRIVVDPTLISEELAPLTPMALWAQRIRWSHGWHQVSRLQVRHIWRARALTIRQRLGASFLLGWREAYPWVAAQMIPILVFSMLVRQQFHVRWLAPLFLVTTVYVSAVGPIQALFAWRLSVPELRRRHAWWWQYVLATGILFGEFKALVNRAAHVRELLGDRAWQVTPRTTDNSEGGIARLRPQRTVTEMVTMGPRPGTTSVVELDRPLRRPPEVGLGLGSELDADLSGLDPGEAVSS